MAQAAALDGNARSAPVGLGAGVVGLLALAIFINYVDRGNLATAAPLIKDQLHLSNTQIGLLLSAFFWTYTPGLLLSGWLAEKINPYRTLALGVAERLARVFDSSTGCRPISAATRLTERMIARSTVLLSSSLMGSPRSILPAKRSRNVAMTCARSDSRIKRASMYAWAS